MAKTTKNGVALTPQAMYNQFKRPSAGSVNFTTFIERLKTIITRMAT